MKLKNIYLNAAHTDADIEPLVRNAVQPTESDYDFIITDYAAVFKPNGEILMKLVPRALSLDYCVSAFDAFHDRLTSVKNSNRPSMVGSLNRGSEGVIGFLDPIYPIQYCRTTALTNAHLDGFKDSLPFIRSAAELMKIHTPERYAAQLAACESGHADYVIPRTPFSTVTINRDVTATYHTDQGDYKPGIGIITATWAENRDKEWHVVTENPAEGALLVFPKYRVAVKLRTQDLVLCDVHEVHGVSPIVGDPGKWARLSFVFYLREKIIQCPRMAEEIIRINAKDTAKHRAKNVG